MTYSQKNPIAFNEKPASSVKMNEEFMQIYGALNEIDGLKAPLESPALTGNPTAPTASKETDTTQLATTAFVKDVVADYAPLESPALTGSPTAPTQAADDDSTKLATTAYVKDQVASDTVAGMVELATPAEVLAGEDDERAVTPAGFKAALADCLQPSMTGSATLNGTTDNTVQLTNIVTALALEVGDVIRIQYSGYDKLHTVESITNDNSIIVNYEHAGNRGNGSLKLADETVTVTITRIAKWYSAPLGLGQEWVSKIPTNSVIYSNSTNRTLAIQSKCTSPGEFSHTLYVDGVELSKSKLSADKISTLSQLVPKNSSYSRVIYNASFNSPFWEMR